MIEQTAAITNREQVGCGVRPATLPVGPAVLGLVVTPVKPADVRQRTVRGQTELFHRGDVQGGEEILKQR